MKTFQDYELVKEVDKSGFILDAITEYKASEMYLKAKIGEDYYKQDNSEIKRVQKWIRNHLGEKKEDIFAANNKMPSSYFNENVVFHTNYLLGNGVLLEGKEKIDPKFDTKMQKSLSIALRQGIAYAFKNVNRIDVFKATEFVPLLDEYTGELRAGIRFWQLDAEKPLNAEFFEEDGFSVYKENKEGKLYLTKEKETYKVTIQADTIEEEVINKENYSSLPVKMLFCNEYKESDLEGKKQMIDLYDRVSSDFANDFDNFSQLYWVIKNAGGMTNEDLMEFQARVKTMGVVSVDGQEEGASADLQQTEIPYSARQIFLEILEKRIYKSFALIDYSTVSNATATEIKSLYAPIDMKADNIEYFVIDFIEQLLSLEKIEEEFTFKRNKIVNELEVTSMILSASNYLDEETMLELLPFIPTDKLEEIKERMNNERDSRIKQLEEEINQQTLETENTEEEEPIEE